jgi:hypothetical protein
MGKLVFGWLIRLGALLGCAALLPRFAGDSAARAFWRAGDAQLELSRSVASQVTAGVAAASFSTGSARFDGEWAFGTFLMATLGLGQTVLSHPEQRASLLPAMQQSAARLVADETNAFGSAAWGARGLAELAHGQGHGYLGYANLALSMLRLIDADTAQAALNDELTEALSRRLAAAPHALFETYPGEAYPPDMAMVAGSIALHDCAVGRAERDFMPNWRQAFARYIDTDSGLLYQAANAASGEAIDSPRGSGTAVAAYALSFASPELSRKLWSGLRPQAVNVLGFGMMREYPRGRTGRGDIDSGPVLLGLGVSATGFALAGARLHGDEQLFTELYRTVDLFGVPLRDHDSRHFMSGGPLGNAILLAMTGASFDWRAHCKRGES